ncbi:MAG: FG-GAP repeat domain-containing protein, partial [Planctomycetota bacterium]
MADLDGDGFPDVVTTTAAGELSVLLGNGDGSFQPAVSYPAGDYLRSVAVADLDGDAVPDVVTASLDGWTGETDLSVLLGNGDGSLQAPLSYPAGVGGWSLAVADLDGDAVPDAVTATLEGELSVLLGNGDGSFRPAVSYPAGFFPESLAVADLDADGVPDLIIANAIVVAPAGVPMLASAYVRVLLGNGDGSFPAAVELPTGEEAPTRVVVADLDADAVPDLVSAHPGISTPFIVTGYVSVLLGDGERSFQTAVSYPAGASPNWVSAADLNGDGVLDLVTTNSFSNDVSVLLGNGDGSFQPAVSFPTSNSPRSLAVADLNGDGVLDLVTGRRGGNAVSVLLGNGDGSFQAALSYPAGNFPQSVAVADLDGDGVPDVVSANASIASGPGEVS